MRHSFRLLWPMLALMAVGPVLGYWNLDPKAGISGGAHRAINRCAWDLWVTTQIREASHEDPILRQYRFKETDLRTLVGPTYTNRGNWPDDMSTGDTSLNVPMWVAEGGFTADEPEVSACQRHFYDPTAAEGERYLTDIPWQGQLREYIRSTWRRDVETVNPRIDARALAMGVGEYAYSWRQGPVALRRALSDLPVRKEDRERATAMFWRALGEVMHLMADMTMASHTRNDGHPGALPAGRLRPDPYEEWILGPEVEAAYATIPRTGPLSRLDPEAAMPPEAASAVYGASTPEGLFQAVALYTNQHFVTNDTLSGTDPDGHPVAPVNGHVYPRPTLGRELTWDPEMRIYTAEVKNRGTILMAKRTWQSNSWGNYFFNARLTGGTYGYETNRDCAVSMAQVLVPIAVAANARLLDWYLPRFAVTITGIGPKTLGQPLKGTVEHTPRGVFNEKILATLPDDQTIDLYLDGRRQDPRAYELRLRKGKLEGKLNDLDVADAKRIWVEVELAGIRITSPDFAPVGTVQVRVCTKDVIGDPRDMMGTLAGKPIPNATVTCSFTEAGKPRRLTQTTDKNGECRFVVPLGVEVTVSAEGSEKRATCTPEKPAQGVTFGWQGHDPRGDVIDPGSLPVPRE
ncbi:MAG: carboxypeptidase regulatory-like domain-containing protein [Armatimonadetes bacterium]|nr:carboxypeptidase regulatory-like domain-containing protein [Armatimonadota bacterium]